MHTLSRQQSADMIEEARAEAYQSSYDASVKAERKRLTAIITSPEYAGREKAAQTMAFRSDMPAAAVIEMLASLPKHAEPQQQARLPDTVSLVSSEPSSLGSKGEDFERGREISRRLRNS